MSGNFVDPAYVLPFTRDPKRVWVETIDDADGFVFLGPGGQFLIFNTDLAWSVGAQLLARFRTLLDAHNAGTMHREGQALWDAGDAIDRFAVAGFLTDGGWAQVSDPSDELGLMGTVSRAGSELHLARLIKWMDANLRRVQAGEIPAPTFETVLSWPRIDSRVRQRKS